MFVPAAWVKHYAAILRRWRQVWGLAPRASGCCGPGYPSTRSLVPAAWVTGTAVLLALSCLALGGWLLALELRLYGLLPCG